MQLHTFYEERGLQSFLQTHANATMRVLCVEPTGKDIPSYLPEDTLTVCVDDILEAEYPRMTKWNSLSYTVQGILIV